MLSDFTQSQYDIDSPGREKSILCGSFSRVEPQTLIPFGLMLPSGNRNEAG